MQGWPAQQLGKSMTLGLQPAILRSSMKSLHAPVLGWWRQFYIGYSFCLARVGTLQACRTLSFLN